MTAAQAQPLPQDFMPMMAAHTIALTPDLSQPLAALINNHTLAAIPELQVISDRLQSPQPTIAALDLLNLCMAPGTETVCAQLQHHGDYLVQSIAAVRLAIAANVAGAEALWALLHNPAIATDQQRLLKTLCLDVGLQAATLETGTMTVAEIQQQLAAAVQSRLGRAVGIPAPEFTIQDEQGREITLAQFRGRSLLIHFWAAGCPGCVEQLPALAAQAQAWEGDRLAVLWVNLDGDRTAAAAVLAPLVLPGIQVWINFEHPMVQAFGVQIIPWDVAIDETGIIQGYDWAAIEPNPDSPD